MTWPTLRDPSSLILSVVALMSFSKEAVNWCW
jgi:hypothetical protein